LNGSLLPPKPPPLGVAMTDVRRRHRQRLRERAVDVVRRLRTRPEHELAVGILGGDGRMLLDRQMRVALVEEGVFEDAVGAGERPLDVAEPQRHGLVDVSGIAVLVDARLRVREAFFGIVERAQRLVLDVDEVERFERGQLVARDHRGDRVADEAYAADRERVLVLAHREDAVGNGEVGAGQHQVDAGTREGTRDVDPDDPRVRHRRAQQLAVHHPRQHHIVRELRLAGDLRAAVDAAAGCADYPHRARSPERLALRMTAASTASKICWYPVQRQRHPASASRI